MLHFFFLQTHNFLIEDFEKGIVEIILHIAGLSSKIGKGGLKLAP